MQEFHFVHHKKPLLNHGITTDIWDRVFGTYYQWSKEDLKGIEKLKRIKK
jgi:sterol desaturase/sphingolipid hydroxylase (fatty acid hydroxylase superfamily)